MDLGHLEKDEDKEGNSSFYAQKWRKEYGKGSLNLKDLPKHGGSQGERIAERRESGKGLQSEVWSLSLLGHDLLVSSSSFVVGFLQGKGVLMEVSRCLQWSFKRERDGGRQQ